MLEDLFNCSHHPHLALVSHFQQLPETHSAKLLFILLHYYFMLKYFLEEEQPHLHTRTRRLIKKIHLQRREYRGFHLDCPFTKKKLCYCSAHPISSLSQDNRASLWESYEEADRFFNKVDSTEVQQADQLFEKCKRKIRALSCAEVAEFIRTYRNEKNIHMGENGEFDGV